MDILRLYPQYNQKSERRQQDVFVPFERRSGIDRRGSDRPVLDRKLQNDIFEMKDVFKDFRPKREEKKKNEGLAALILSPIPYFRRFSGIEDAVKAHDYIKAGGKAFLQLINVREDWSDILKIFKKSGMPKEYQVRFSCIRNTLLDNKYIQDDFIDKIDRTLDQTRIGSYILSKLGMKDLDFHLMEELDEFGNLVPKLDKKGRIIAGYQVVGGNSITKLIGRAMMRVPILSVVFLSLLEIPSIVKSDKPVRQIIKSTISVTSIIAGGAIFGALGATTLGNGMGSLAGLGFGSYLGNKFANYINNQIFGK